MNPDDSDDEDTAPTYRSCAFGCDFASFGSVSCTPPNLSRESSLGGTATAMGSCALLTPTISRSASGEVQKNEYAKLNSYMGAAPQSGGFTGELSRAVCASTAPAGPLAPRRQAAVPHAPWDQHQLEAPTECRSAEGAEVSNEVCPASQTLEVVCRTQIHLHPFRPHRRGRAVTQPRHRRAKRRATTWRRSAHSGRGCAWRMLSCTRSAAPPDR